jgi:hypothetical protein
MKPVNHGRRLSVESLEQRLNLSAAPFLASLPDNAHAIRFDSEVSIAARIGSLHSLAARDAAQTDPLSVGGKPSAQPTTTIATPSNVTASPLSTTQVSVRWSPNTSGAAGYYVYRATGLGSYSKIATINSAATGSYTDNGLAASTTYNYYVVAFKKNTLSGASAIATATTLAPPVITAPNTPSNLGVTGADTASISLAWSDAATNETGYRVYRSTNGATYSLIANLGANATSYTDAGLTSSTQYYYQVAAWNSAGEGLTSPISAATTAFIPSGDPVSLATRYGNELVITGTSGNDSIFVSQSGFTLTVVANGITTTAAVPGAGLFIYSNRGSDQITIDGSVSLRTTIASIDAASTAISSAGLNVSAWVDSTDSFSGSGSLHRVASFYAGVSKNIGINIADPSDAGATFRANASLWGTGPTLNDVNQGGIGDCYFLASLSAFANTSPARLQEMAVDLGDGTYAVQYMRGGTASFVRVDGDLSSGAYWGYAYARPGANGNLWGVIMEKSYALFRNGANSYSSLNNGWMGNVYSDLGIANSNLSLSVSDTSLYNTLSNALNTGKPVTFATYTGGTTLVASHAYTLVSVANIGGTNYYTVRNPWGVSGNSLENSSGLATLTLAQMQSNFQMGTIAV